MKGKTLSEYYKSLSHKPKAPSPRSEFKKKLMEECYVAEQTVWKWLNGTVVPDKLTQEKISKITGIPVNELFKNENAN